MTKKRRFWFLKFNKARTDQAGFFRRFMAFLIDAVIITLVAMLFLKLITLGMTYLADTWGFYTKFEESRNDLDSYLKEIERDLPPDDYQRARITVDDLQKRHLIEAPSSEEGNLDEEVERLDIFDFIREFIGGYLYFILFFRFGGRTPGKRMFRLQVIDLKRRKRLGWYQAFERTHGYAASLLLAGIGFLQVLWDPEGLTMHDRLAGTTVILLPKKEKKKKEKKRNKGKANNS